MNVLVPACSSLRSEPEQSSTWVSQKSLRSAEVVVPLLLRFVAPESAIDLGCKHGEWLSILKQHGVRRVRGLDKPVCRPHLVIDPTEFEAADLARADALGARFDLALCLEVAEHLPAAAARPLVQQLTAAAPVVLFSAAIPDQGGKQHVNEQPRAYWHDLFAGCGYTPIDCLRPYIWQDDRVAWWYRQNLFLYSGPAGLTKYPLLQSESRRQRATDVDLVHVTPSRRDRREPLWTRLRELSHRATRLLRVTTAE